MKLKPEIVNGKVVGVKPAELTDQEKALKAIYALIGENKAKNVGKVHYSLIPESLKINSHDKNPLGQGKKTMYGYPCYSHSVDADFSLHVDYNPKAKGWASHKVVKGHATATFHDIDNEQIRNFQDVKIIQSKLDIEAHQK